MPKVLQTAVVTLPANPLVMYFANRKPAPKDNPFEDLTRRVVQLQVLELEGDRNFTHAIRRLDKAGTVVWDTKHLSAAEARWAAEWEYNLQATDWKAPS